MRKSATIQPYLFWSALSAETPQTLRISALRGKSGGPCCRQRQPWLRNAEVPPAGHVSKGMNNLMVLTTTRCASDMAAWSIPMGISCGSPPEGARGTNMVAKVGVSKVYDQKEILVNLITEGHHKPEVRRCFSGSYKVGDGWGLWSGREDASCRGKRERERKLRGFKPQRQDQPVDLKGRAVQAQSWYSGPRCSGKAPRRDCCGLSLTGGTSAQRGAGRSSEG